MLIQIYKFIAPGLYKNEKKALLPYLISTPILFLLVLVFIQIIVGAFVSGLDAGRIYQTWPLMGYNYMPDDVNFSEIKNLFDLNNHSLVQFYH